MAVLWIRGIHRLLLRVGELSRQKFRPSCLVKLLLLLDELNVSSLVVNRLFLSDHYTFFAEIKLRQFRFKAFHVLGYCEASLVSYYQDHFAATLSNNRESLHLISLKLNCSSKGVLFFLQKVSDRH